MNKNKKLILFIGIPLLIVALACAITIVAIKNQKVKIAIYDLPDKISQTIEEYVLKSNKKTTVSIINSETGLSVTDAKKYDAIFTFNSAMAKHFAENAKELPNNLYAQMPTAVRRSGKIGEKNLMLPILMEHAPIYICKEAMTFNSDQGPESLEELENAIDMDRESFSFAMILSGSKDRDMYDFLSMVCESILGSDGYKNLIAKISEKIDFAEVLDEVVAEKSDGTKMSLRTVLNKIKFWQEKNYIQQQWTQVSESDLNTLMQRMDFYVTSRPLTEYRNLPRRVSYNYAAFRFPVEDMNINHGVIASEVMMISMKGKKSVAELGKHLVSLNIQEQISNLTSYAPSHSQAGAYDSIADDTRFYAAASKDGPLPSLDMAAFTQKSQAQKFAEDVRKFLR